MTIENPGLQAAYQQLQDSYYNETFRNHENHFRHNPISHELRQLHAIEQGDIEDLMTVLDEDFASNEGRVADNPLRQRINIGIVCVTIASRTAINAGVHYEKAFTLSDVCIRLMEECKSTSQVAELYKAVQIHYAEMVRDISWEDETQRNADTAIIIREADRLTALVNEILEYSRLQESGYQIKADDVDLTALVNRVADQFAPLMEQEGVRIEREIADGCFIKGDAALLERAVYNLIDNALRHAGEEKKITLTLTGEPEVRLSVRDYGEGIDPEELPHIWERYYTSRQRGKKGVSGLGLAIVKQIAGLHGARYGADSRKGEGSTFWLAFS